MPPNVLYLVLDCLRRDAIDPERTPTLAALADDNCSFEQCVPPAHWSLPSHASIFTGEYPHEHGVYHRGHSMDSLPLVEDLARRGFRTVGVTSNLYFSRGQGFDRGFDEFYETRRPLNPHGLNPFSAVRERQPSGDPGLGTYASVLREAVQHDRPLSSLRNYLYAVGTELDRRYGYRRHLPWKDDDDYGRLHEADDRSERLVRETFQRSGDDPFFCFVNFMGAHFPYEPTAEHLAAETDGTYGIEDLRDLQPDLSNTWTFLDQVHGDGVDDDDLDLVRAGYFATVRSLDERVERLLDELERHDLRDDTLVVITSDHGEALGEPDLRGDRSMGHLNSLNEWLRTVPLLLVHPDIEPVTVEKCVSLTALTRGLRREEDPVVQNPESILRHDATATFFELPSNPYHRSSYERYEHIPEWYVDRETATNTVLGLRGAWAVAADSNDDVWAWQNGDEKPVDDAPDTLVSSCISAAFAYENGEEARREQPLSSDLEEQLEDLGYL